MAPYSSSSVIQVSRSSEMPNLYEKTHNNKLIWNLGTSKNLDYVIREADNDWIFIFAWISPLSKSVKYSVKKKQVLVLYSKYYWNKTAVISGYPYDPLYHLFI